MSFNVLDMEIGHEVCEMVEIGLRGYENCKGEKSIRSGVVNYAGILGSSLQPVGTHHSGQDSAGR
jgi:hypothetical protein